MDSFRCGLLCALAVLAVTSMAEAHESVVTQDIPSEVRRVIELKCLSCHSSQPHSPWYGKVPGVKQYLDHVHAEAFEHMPFEKWLKGETHLHARQLHEIEEEVEEGHMPPRTYTLFRPKEKLTKKEKELILNWLKSEQVTKREKG